MTSCPVCDSHELAEAVGRILIVGFEGTEFSELESLITGIRPAGLIFFKRNYPETDGPSSLRRLITAAQDMAQSCLGRRLFVAIDHEGGTVQRLPAPYVSLPSAQDAGAQSLGNALELAAKAGRELAATGFNFNLAPVLDVASPVSTIMGTRCFSDNPERVADYGRAVMEGYRNSGVLTCGKHFPGLGAALIDPHHELPTVEIDHRRLMEVDLEPFRELVENGLGAVMTTHALYPVLDDMNPATFSSHIVEILKKEMMFGGAVVTDDLEMGAVVKNYPMGEAAVSAVQAGHDLALVCRRATYVEECAKALASAALSGQISEARLADAHERSSRLYENLESIWPEKSRLDVWFEELQG
ncbi:beta-N-acetylhexosaminidase [Deltaproteobacteria bacterium Smac51]|nr:beta-N-acetylhexosaminidase [Deltaproteobacteria bacterium Smac51]